MYDITVALCLGGLLIASVHALAVVLTVQLTRRGIVTAWHTKSSWGIGPSTSGVRLNQACPARPGLVCSIMECATSHIIVVSLQLGLLVLFSSWRSCLPNRE